MFKPMDERTPAPATKPEPSVAGFIAWLETKDPSEGYHWADWDFCAVGQYLASFNRVIRDIPDTPYWRVCMELNSYAHSAHPQTFGALLQRVKAHAGNASS